MPQHIHEAVETNFEQARRSVVSGGNRPDPGSLRRASASVDAIHKSRTRERAAPQCDDDLQVLLVGTVPNLRAFAISLCGDPTRSDDLVQETLVKAWTNLANFQKGTNLKAWLFTILRNTYFSELRKGHREVEDADETYAERMYVLPDQQGHMHVIDFMKAFGSLNDDQKEALLLVGAEGFSYMEAAKISGTAVGTIKSRVSRARAALTISLGFDAGENCDSNAEFSGLVRTGQAM